MLKKRIMGGLIMSLEKNKAIVYKMFEAFNKRNLASLDELIAHDYVDHTNNLRGLEDVKQFLTMLIKGFPDLLMTIEDIIAEEDKVWVRVKVAGTNTGEFRGEAPTGKKFVYTDVHNFRIVYDKIIEDIMVSSHS
jgi:predicted ester cyclase